MLSSSVVDSYSVAPELSIHPSALYACGTAHTQLPMTCMTQLLELKHLLSILRGIGVVDRSDF